MFGVIMQLCNRMFCLIFGWYFYIEIRLKYEQIILLSSSISFSLFNPMKNFFTSIFTRYFWHFHMFVSHTTSEGILAHFARVLLPVFFCWLDWRPRHGHKRDRTKPVSGSLYSYIQFWTPKKLKIKKSKKFYKKDIM